MIRLLLFLLGTLTVNKPGQREAAARYLADDSQGRDGALFPDSDGPGQVDAWPDQDGPVSPWRPRAAGGVSPGSPGRTGRVPVPRRRRISPLVKWTAALVVVGLVFRRTIAFVVLTALSAALHLVGVNIHLPTVRFAWPWQSISAGSATNTDLGPWVLQKIEGISKPALGQATFNFLFAHKVSKSIGPWPCWYASTFYAVGHASATVDLNPGPAWWAPTAGHYQLRILSQPQQGKPGHVAVAMVLPQPQLPQSVHDITIDNVPSKPVDTQHSWTYPGFGCGVLLRPQFPESVLYSQAQQIAFYRSNHDLQVTRPLIRTAETEAARTIRDNFIQPTLNALGYTLDRFTLGWATSAP